MSEQARAWVYRVLTAAVPLAIAYGVVDDRTASLWVAFAGAVLGLGLATVNTSTRPAPGVDPAAVHLEPLDVSAFDVPDEV